MGRRRASKENENAGFGGLEESGERRKVMEVGCIGRVEEERRQKQKQGKKLAEVIFAGLRIYIYMIYILICFLN